MKKYKLAKRYRTENLQKIVGWGILVLITLFCFASCQSAKTIEQVPVYVHDTAYIAKVQHDSTYIDHFREVTKMMNDTILVRDSVVMYRWSVKTDTAYKYIEKPVTVTKTEVVEVQKPLGWWGKLFRAIGIIALLAVVGWGVYVFVRRKFLF